MAHAIKGKSKNNWIARTLCDFGGFDPMGPIGNKDRPDRKDEMGRHFSLPSAFRQFKRICKIYAGTNRSGWEKYWRVWMEDRSGRVLADSNLLQVVTS